MRTRFVYENAHEANLMATAEVNYYRSCDLQLIGSRTELAAYARGWRKPRLAPVLLLEGADPTETPAQLRASTRRRARATAPACGATPHRGGARPAGRLTPQGPRPRQ